MRYYWLSWTPTQYFNVLGKFLFFLQNAVEMFIRNQLMVKACGIFPVVIGTSQSVRGVNSHFKIIPPFLKSSHPLSLPTNQPFQVFLTNENETVKFIKFIKYYACIKQQYNAGVFIFKFTLKYMLQVKGLQNISVFSWFYVYSTVTAIAMLML